jgi:hypothetical protein
MRGKKEMGRKSREKHGFKATPARNVQASPRKKGFSNGKKVLIGVTLIAVIVIAASIALSSQPSQQEGQQQTGGSYPQNAAPVTYNSPAVSQDGSQVTVPVSSVNSSKLVFVDLKLKTPMQTLEYQGRTVPLAYYRNGEYLPLVLISTPSGNTVAGIRTCEPCGSFSFHIVKGTNLKCDTCGAEWRLEDFAPASGGCADYPPPKLSTSVNGGNVDVDLSALSLQFAA